MQECAQVQVFDCCERGSVERMGHKRYLQPPRQLLKGKGPRRSRHSGSCFFSPCNPSLSRQHIVTFSEIWKMFKTVFRACVCPAIDVVCSFGITKCLHKSFQQRSMNSSSLSMSQCERGGGKKCPPPR